MSMCAPYLHGQSFPGSLQVNLAEGMARFASRHGHNNAGQILASTLLGPGGRPRCAGVQPCNSLDTVPDWHPIRA